MMKNNKVDNVTETSEDESENDKNNNVSVTGTVPPHFVHREDARHNLILSDQEERIIMKNEMLTDESINLAQNHLHEAFPSISGLQDTAIGATQTFNVVNGNFIQILRDGNLHHYIFIISQLRLTSHPRSTVVLLDTETPGTSREIYSEDANGETRTRNPWITNPVL